MKRTTDLSISASDSANDSVNPIIFLSLESTPEEITWSEFCFAVSLKVLSLSTTAATRVGKSPPWPLLCEERRESSVSYVFSVPAIADSESDS